MKLIKREIDGTQDELRSRYDDILGAVVVTTGKKEVEGKEGAPEQSRTLLIK